MFKRKSILFVIPDYHCSFVLRDELRKLGWRADVYIPYNYPEKLLYKNEGLSLASLKKIKNKKVRRVLVRVLRLTYLFFALFRYKHFLFYGTMDVLPLGRVLRRFFGDDFRLYLELGKLLKKKFLYLPTGCRDWELRSNFEKFDNGNVCNNCGYLTCEDEVLIPRFKLHRRYGDFFVGVGIYNSTQFPQTHVKYKSLDLSLWHPDIKIPKNFLLPPTQNLRIMHSFVKGGRIEPGKNIKGSPFILEAIERLKKEGYPVEHCCIQDVYSKYMRYYQVQADIIVEQLIYGWWGSTGVETMALGKPVVCYLRPSWKEFFLKTFPEYESLPIVEASTDTIYEVLKMLVADKEYREQKGRESRLFAEHHFDAKKNAAELEKVFLRRY